MRLVRALALFGFVAAAVVLLASSDSLAQVADTKAEKKAAKMKAKLEKQKAVEDAAKKSEDETKKADEERKAAEAKRAAAKATRATQVSTFDAAAAAKLIDTHIDKKLADKKIAPSPICSDEEFLRRAHLDITGVIPTADKAKAFLDDKATDKRAKLVDELLADANYGRKQADIWTAKLFTKDSGNRFVQRAPFYKWIEAEFNANRPWNQFVTSVVTATGTVDEHPEVTYFLSNRSIDKLTDTTSQHFLGVRLSCAQCHNHPFTTTKQTEYWGLAAFYSKVNPERPKNANQGGDNSKLGVQEGNTKTKLKDFFPESAKTVPPKFLEGESPKLGSSVPYRPALAEWLTDAKNPFFAKAMVNRTWAALFGRGIVNPIDDMIDTNEPSHPELLAELSAKFAAGGFDVKLLVKGVVLSRAYQRTSKPTAANKADADHYSHQQIKVLSPEMLYDSLTRVVGTPPAAKGPAGGGAANRAGAVTPRDRFVEFFLAGSDEPKAAEYEAGIPQALRLINGRNTQPATLKLLGGSKGAEAFEKIYLAALSRRPTADEVKRLTDYVAKASTPGEGYGDVLWAVLNSSEFAMVR